MHTGGSVAPSGALSLEVIRRSSTPDDLGQIPLTAWPTADSLRAIIEHGLPQRGLPDEVNEWRLRNSKNLWRGARRVLAAKAMGIGHMYGALWLDVLRGDGTHVPLGLASLRVVTTAGVTYLVDTFQGTGEPENFKYHGYGVGTTAEASGDTALVTELTTEYAVNSTRPTGSQTEASATVYRTVGTVTPDSGGTLAITEHGIFSATSAGTLWDRSKFAAVNLDSTLGDSLQTTYDGTFPAGS